ncbi:glycosyltransferase family 4 protein [Winogradskyella sp. MIT101101]|uniref:glycosyltransferase family 4 protein n=1 Tax=Winogradskyella sp. MIT101101 TaxID=3098297 RepID=UPI00399A6857
MKQSLLIIGPIADIGGRELETGFIASTLEENYDITVLSTAYYTSKSQIFDLISRQRVKNLDALIYKQNLWFRFLALISYLKSLKKESVLQCVSNNLSKKTGYRTLAIDLIKREIDKKDAVFMCAQLSSNYIKEVVEYSKSNDKPIVLRTSNTIRKLDEKQNEWIANIDLFIHHSMSNANRLTFLNNYKYLLIDQCTFRENEMLMIPPTKKFKTILFVGRLSYEKGILELVNLFQDYKIELDLKVIGDGQLFDEIKGVSSKLKNVELLGFLKQNEILDQLKKADAVIIPSFEESGPLVGLEAMASARLVLSTKVGAMEERLKDCENQFWFNVNNLDTLKSLIDRISAFYPEDIERIAIGNRKRYLEKYKMETIKSQYKSAIFNLLNHPRKESV